MLLPSLLKVLQCSKLSRLPASFPRPPAPSPVERLLARVPTPGLWRQYARTNEEYRDRTGPLLSGAGAKPRTVVTVEVFKEEDQIAPVRIILKPPGSSVNRPSGRSSRRKVPASRREISLATSNSVM